jgi:hypothetical protein
MVDGDRIGTLDAAEILSPAVREIILHLCRGECHSYGAVVEWCETRGDCAMAVVCSVCDRQFLIDDDELAELVRWTDSAGKALVCGVRWE